MLASAVGWPQAGRVEVSSSNAMEKIKGVDVHGAFEGSGKDGKPQAVNIARKAIGKKPPQRIQKAKSKSRNSFVGTVLAGALLLGISLIGFKYVQGHINRHELSQQTPQSSIMPTESRASLLDRRCDGRTQCSQMTSCAEAKWFINNCPGTQMDGNRDGTPCEQQWCTSPFAY